MTVLVKSQISDDIAIFKKDKTEEDLREKITNKFKIISGLFTVKLLTKDLTKTMTLPISCDKRTKQNFNNIGVSVNYKDHHIKLVNIVEYLGITNNNEVYKKMEILQKWFLKIILGKQMSCSLNLYLEAKFSTLHICFTKKSRFTPQTSKFAKNAH